MDKTCKICNITKPLSEFYLTTNKKYHVGSCKDCTREVVKANRHKNIDYYRSYDNNRQKFDLNRKKSHTYSGIKQRSEGTSGRVYHVKGLPYLSRQEFDDWFDENLSAYQELFLQWKLSGFKAKLQPTVDRVDNHIGYVASNMRWMTKSDNSKKYNFN